MCAFLYPDEYLDSTYSIDFDQLYKEGYRGIIFDIDNTLVPHGAPISGKLPSYLQALHVVRGCYQYQI